MKKLLASVLLSLAACDGSLNFELQIVFPDNESKKRVNYLEIWALYSENDYSCVNLQTGLSRPESFERLAHLAFHFPTSQTPVLKGVRNGPVIFFAEGRASNAILLRGCTKRYEKHTGPVILNLLCVCNPDFDCTPQVENLADRLDNDCDGATDEQCISDQDCHDGFDCTRDSCQLDSGLCQNVPDDSLCPQDERFCNGPEVCRAGQGCVSSGNPCRQSGLVCREQQKECTSCITSSECSDDIPCTHDICQPTGFCFSEPDDSACEDDGFFCNGAEYCDSVVGCTHRGNPCQPQEVCDEFTDSCLPCPNCRPFSSWWTISGGAVTIIGDYRLQIHVGPAVAGSITSGDRKIQLGPAAVGKK